MYSLRCRCRNRTWFKDYTNSLTQVNKEITSDLDLVKFMRRIRAHGLALSMVADPELINITNNLSRTKELRPADRKERNKLWKVYEDYAFKEKMVLAFVKRYMKVINF